MVRNRCIRSFAVSTVLCSVIIVFQLFLFEDTASDAESFLREQNVLVTDTGDERARNHWAAIKSISLICPNCTFANMSSRNRTPGNNTAHVHDAVYSYLRQYVHRLNRAPVVRNLDKFDIPADNEGSLVIVIQVQCHSYVCLFSTEFLSILFALYCMNTSFELFVMSNRSKLILLFKVLNIFISRLVVILYDFRMNKLSLLHPHI